ncbi:unannotated protein [freshwater metagenome]|uniref:Unannotated protein n=1 Tax=freshwater metagenome TaxID=449393 RepID=A0A6J6H113_9ZZZZ
MSLALRTNERAIMSTPRRIPQRRSSSSFSERAGTFTATPGRLIPLLFETKPGTSTTVVTVSLVTSVALRVTFPSSIKSRSPTLTSPHRPLKVVPQISFVPSTSLMVILKVSPFSSMCGPSAKRARRIFGPCRSTKIPTALSTSAAALRTVR